MPKVLRGEQVDRFKEKFNQLSYDKKKLVSQNVKIGKDGTLTILNYSMVVSIMRGYGEDEL